MTYDQAERLIDAIIISIGLTVSTGAVAIVVMLAIINGTLRGLRRQLGNQVQKIHIAVPIPSDEHNRSARHAEQPEQP